MKQDMTIAAVQDRVDDISKQISNVNFNVRV